MTEPPDIMLTLPLPPSTNRIVRGGMTFGGRRNFYSPKTYREWQDLVLALCAAQRADDRIPYRYRMRMTLPEQRKDPSNLIKPVEDVLQKARVIANDRHLRSFALDVDPAREPGSMLVELWGLPDPAPKKCAPRAGKVQAAKGLKKIGAQRLEPAAPRRSTNKDYRMIDKVNTSNGGTLTRKRRVVKSQ
jgi:Holliday junction resolvase RusA-like endonuclease